MFSSPEMGPRGGPPSTSPGDLRPSFHRTLGQLSVTLIGGSPKPTNSLAPRSANGFPLPVRISARRPKRSEQVVTHTKPIRQSPEPRPCKCRSLPARAGEKAPTHLPASHCQEVAFAGLPTPPPIGQEPLSSPASRRSSSLVPYYYLGSRCGGLRPVVLKETKLSLPFGPEYNTVLTFFPRSNPPPARAPSQSFTTSEGGPPLSR